MAKRRGTSTASKRPTVGGLSLKPSSTATPPAPKRLKGEQVNKKKAPPSTARADSIPTQSSFFTKVPPEIRNNIYELSYGKPELIKAVPKRPRSSTQKAHKSILDPLLVCRRWYEESVVIFVSSAEFQFDNFIDFSIAATRLGPVVKNSITSISWREPDKYLQLDTEVPSLCASFPELKILRLIIPDRAFRDRHHMLSPVHVLEQNQELMTDNMFRNVYGMYGLRSLRGLEDFSWINDNPAVPSWVTDPPNPLLAGRTIYQCNWDAFSEWVRKDVIKKARS